MTDIVLILCAACLLTGVIYICVRLHRKVENTKKSPTTDLPLIMENNQLLEAIFENAPVVMILVGENTNVIKINQFGKELGLDTSKTFVGVQPGDAINCITALSSNGGCGKGNQCSRCKLRSSIKTTFETRCGQKKVPLSVSVQRDMIPQTFNMLLSTSFIEMKNSPMTLLVLEDITSIVKTEKALAESEFRYKQITRAITDYIYTVAVYADGDIITNHTPGCFPVTGYHAEEFKDNPSLWFNIIVDEDRELVKFFIRHLDNNYEIPKIEYRIIHKDNSIRWVSNTLVKKAGQGPITYYDGAIHDITARKGAEDQLRKSEEKFRNIFNTSNDAIFITDFDSRVLEVNQISVDRSGIPFEQLLNMRLIDLIAPQDREQAKIQFENLRLDKNAFFQTNYINRRGEKVYIEILGHSINYNGRLAALLVSRDITERIVMQQRILNAIVEAEEKERSLFSQELHDGLGPILSTVKLYLQWIHDPDARTDKSALLADALRTIEEAISSVREISNRMSPAVLKKFGFKTAIQSYVKKISGLTNVNFTLDINLSERIRPEIEAMMYRVFVEAINNTMKYASASNVYLSLEMGNEGLCAVYRDDGVGFDINRKFRSGNGLFNMQNRVETYEGWFSIKSNPGEGIEIAFSIPIHRYVIPD